MAGNLRIRNSRTVVTPGLCCGRLSLDGDLAITMIMLVVDPIRAFLIYIDTDSI
jgi:hypothetical protein